MSKDPAFLFYSNNFLSGTMLMTDEQVGKYIRLLIAQHQNGHLSEDHMIFICKSQDPLIWSKFTKDKNGLYYNERLDIEINKRLNYCESRGNNKKGHKKDQSSEDHMKIISKSYENHTSILNTQDSISDNIKGGPGGLFMDLEQLRVELHNSFMWINNLIKNLKVDKHTIHEKIDQFLATLENRDEAGKDLQDAKRHFSNWLEKNLINGKHEKPSYDQQVFDYVTKGPGNRK